MNKEVSDIATSFRRAMRRFPAAVTVVTTRWKDNDVGMTATAVTSLSMEPPSLLLCANRGTGFHTAMEEVEHFCVNVLREGQQDISSSFGGLPAAERRFSIGDWRDEDGIPYLADAQAVIFCRKSALFGHATHSIIVGEATRILVREEVAPLLYVDGRYAAILPLP
jgi:flavin reductase (DIM6/NTAB) family NADH-FMN oxidoreductase RutF